jgi:hypothetical protein
MWRIAGQYQLSIKPRRRVQQMVLGALGIIMGGQIDVWEAYRERLLAITHPAPHQHRTEIRNS